MHLFNRLRTHWRGLAKGALVLAALSLLTVWLALTPPGILGKADAIGYSVCHRIEARSFFIGERPTPLCARCSGMYLGMLAGFAYQLRMGRRAALPPLRISIPLSLFLITFGVDGLNSYLHFFPNAPRVYEPSNLLRLATGSGLGVLVAVMFLPIFHQYMWSNADPRPAVTNYRQALALLGVTALAATLMYLEIPALIVLLALFSAAGVWLVLTLCYTLLWVTVLRRECRYTGWKAAWLPLLAGFTTALVQIGAVDFLRYTLTGTWAGFSL